MSKIEEFPALGQSIWYDDISRRFVQSGELQALIAQGLRGITSNPAIFEKAIAGSEDYDEEIKELAAGLASEAIYEKLALKDIAQAADLMLPVYTAADGQDGYVSIEVSPKLAYDTAGTIAEARRLHKLLGRRNIMIKVPATAQGLPALTELIAAGLSVNVTLIFNIDNYRRVAAAYLEGLKALSRRGGQLSGVSSVASFFVSRIDAAVDAELDKAGGAALKGKTAIANAKNSYLAFKERFAGPEWDALAARGARPQRLLWASTGVKNPAYPDTLYVDGLIGGPTVNTVPPATLKAFLDHGTAAPTLEKDSAWALEHLAQLARLGIDLGTITDRLQTEGVDAFGKSFENIMTAIRAKAGK